MRYHDFIHGLLVVLKVSFPRLESWLAVGENFRWPMKFIEAWPARVAVDLHQLHVTTLLEIRLSTIFTFNAIDYDPYRWQNGIL